MTENMAARGEGLKELDAISDLLHEHAVGLRSTNALRAREIRVLASRLDRAQVMLETALEVAAAKASMRSRSVVCDEIQTPHSYAICSCTQGHRNAQPALEAAPPQAPQEPTAERNRLVVPSLWRIERCTKHGNYEPDCCRCNEEVLTVRTEKAYRAGFKAALAVKDTHMDSGNVLRDVGTATRENLLGREQRTANVSIPESVELTSYEQDQRRQSGISYGQPAATQEQPAGSVDFGHETNHACEHGIFTSENHCEKCDSGSPRKVGEDGASELKVGDSVRVSGIVESISTDGTLIKVDFGMGEYCYPNRLLLHPRSSSVPVGEQK